MLEHIFTYHFVHIFGIVMLVALYEIDTTLYKNK